MSDGRIDAKAVQQAWEFYCERLDNLEVLEIALNNSGKKCWELVNVLTDGDHWLAVYKRPARQFSPRHIPVRDRVAEMLPGKPR